MTKSFEGPPPISGIEGTGEEVGKKPILKVIVSRHGPKLTAAGEKNAKAAYFDDQVRLGYEQMDISPEDKGLARVATSPVKRAVDTAEIQLSELEKGKHRTKDVIPRKESLAVPFQPESDASDKRFSDDLGVIVNMQKELEPRVRSEVEQEQTGVLVEEREAEIRNRIDMAVISEFFEDENRSEGDKRFDTSWEELADGFAKRYAGFSRHTNMLEKARSEGGEQPKDEPYVQIDVTHSFPNTAFLKKYLVFEDGQRARDMSADEFFERTGGIIPEAGSMDMEYEGGEEKAEAIKVSGEFKPGKRFNGKIDMEALSSLYSHRK
jgi:hypothetical protein